MMTVIGDLALHDATTTDEVPWWYKPVGNLFDQFLGAARVNQLGIAYRQRSRQNFLQRRRVAGLGDELGGPQGPRMARMRRIVLP